MITKLTKIRRISYKGGRKFHNIIEEGEKKVYESLLGTVIV